MTRRKNSDDIAAQEQRVAEFNRMFPLGTKALYTAYPNAEPRATALRSEAWVLSGHTSVVMVDDVPGCVALDALVMCPNEPITPRA